MAIYSLAAGNKVSVKLVGRYLGQMVMYNFTYNLGTAADTTDGPAAVRRLLTKFEEIIWTGALKAACVAAFTADYLQGQVAYPTRQVYERITVGQVGTYAGDADLPSNTAATIARSGSIAGRGRNSSLHLSGLSADMLEGGTWTPAALTLFSAVADVLNQDLIAGTTLLNTWNPIIWTIADTTQNNLVRSASPNPYPRTMRRRTVGLGI